MRASRSAPARTQGGSCRGTLIGVDSARDAWDYRGFGGSGPVTRSYAMADIAADVDRLLKLVGWDTCRVVGVSFGGMVAQEFAVTHPQRVEGLAVACTSAGGEGGSSYALQELLELPAEELVAARLRLLDCRWDIAGLMLTLRIALWPIA